MKSLYKRIEKIEVLARESGLDFYPIQFELCPAHVIHSVGAYGIPTRFNHWSFGKDFYKIRIEHELNLHKIYELVINSNPCQAFLLENISLVEQTIIAAHVFAHSDFFKNNAFTLNTDKDILNTMEKHKDKICRYEESFGSTQVEKVLDAAMAIKTHGGAGETDIISYICSHSHILDDWQKDILMMLKREMAYFVPLRETRIINEGWATFWHSKIMRMLNLSAEEFIEFAQIQGKLLQTNKFFINPYLVGFKIFSQLEKEMGTESLFNIRRNERDLSFLRNYLDKDLIEDLDLYLYAIRDYNWVVIERDWERVKDGFINSLINGGCPIIKIADGNYNNCGELYLHHSYDRWELDEHHARKTMKLIYSLWGKKIYLETVLNNSPVVLTYPD
ncbi:SpoVR family protein [Desulfitibacter alkalitolerans]|uniref:SpoVR family protein n=1 Tax=Desulfitibacter alkalitolerans TaxID=264641 RepID=UPI000688C289|nr:SpoVR family protein [Desulfitibacter alkalitolerans]